MTSQLDGNERAHHESYRSIKLRIPQLILAICGVNKTAYRSEKDVRCKIFFNQCMCIYVHGTLWFQFPLILFWNVGISLRFIQSFT
jgi:hypothetical protein